MRPLGGPPYRYWLRIAAMSTECDMLLERLERAEAPPWRSIREALMVRREIVTATVQN